MEFGIARTPAPIIVLTKLITLLIHDAWPITPSSFPFGVLGRRRAEEGGLVGWSFSADKLVDGIALVVSRSKIGCYFSSMLLLFYAPLSAVRMLSHNGIVYRRVS